MACPTCDHTMKSVGQMHGSTVNLFWCPRCGTLKANTQHEYDEVPKAVDTLQALADEQQGPPLHRRKEQWEAVMREARKMLRIEE